MSIDRSRIIRLVQNACAVAAAAAVVSVGLALPASAAPATIRRESIAAPFVEPGIPDDCRPGITGTLAGLHRLDYHSVERPTGYQFIGTAVDVGKITWSDGTYTLVESVDHFSFIGGRGASVNTNTHEDTAYTYSAAGVLLNGAPYHGVHHYTLVDGEITSEFFRAHFTGDPCS